MCRSMNETHRKPSKFSMKSTGENIYFSHFSYILPISVIFFLFQLYSSYFSYIFPISVIFFLFQLYSSHFSYILYISVIFFLFQLYSFYFSYILSISVIFFLFQLYTSNFSYILSISVIFFLFQLYSFYFSYILNYFSYILFISVIFFLFKLYSFYFSYLLPISVIFFQFQLYSSYFSYILPISVIFFPYHLYSSYFSYLLLLPAAGVQGAAGEVHTLGGCRERPQMECKLKLITFTLQGSKVNSVTFRVAVEYLIVLWIFLINWIYFIFIKPEIPQFLRNKFAKLRDVISHMAVNQYRVGFEGIRASTYTAWAIRLTSGRFVLSDSTFFYDIREYFKLLIDWFIISWLIYRLIDLSIDWFINWMIYRLIDLIDW